MRTTLNHSAPSFQLRLDKGFRYAAINSAKNDNEVTKIRQLIREVEKCGDSKTNLKFIDGDEEKAHFIMTNDCMGNTQAEVHPGIRCQWEESNPYFLILKNFTSKLIENSENILFKRFAKENLSTKAPEEALDTLLDNIDLKTYKRLKIFTKSGTEPVETPTGFQKRKQFVLDKLETLDKI